MAYANNNTEVNMIKKTMMLLILSTGLINPVHAIQQTSDPQTQVAPAAALSSELAAATAGLASLKELAGQDAYQSLGFITASEVDEASLGTPIAIKIIGYDELATLSPEAAPPRNDTP